MTELYSRDMLRLAAMIPNVGKPDSFTHSSRKVSRICGSKLTLWVTLEADRITDFGLEVKACAIGQAATSLVAQHLVGLTPHTLKPLDKAYRRMIAEGVADFSPEFEDFALLLPVFEHKSRHGSALLPFECLAEIFSGA